MVMFCQLGRNNMLLLHRRKFITERAPSITDALGKVSHLLLLDHKGYGYSPPRYSNLRQAPQVQFHQPLVFVVASVIHDVVNDIRVLLAENKTLWLKAQGASLKFNTHL